MSRELIQNFNLALVNLNIISRLGNIVGKTLNDNPQQALSVAKSGQECSAL
jgi:hypothetical protein